MRWRRIVLGVLVVVAVLAAAGDIMLSRAAPIVKGRILETLNARFNSRIELDSLSASLLRGIEISGGGLRIYPPQDVAAAGASRPLIAIQHFSFYTGMSGLLEHPTHIGSVQIDGMTIYIPPKDQRRQDLGVDRNIHSKIKIVVDEIDCRDSHLIVGTDKPGKDPKDFELRRIDLRTVGGQQPWQYVATLTNAVPRGDIQASGTFGPWVTESPGDSSVSGHYVFSHADLGTIKGIGGTLSSVGNFSGQLNKIAVQGTTTTPDFSIETGEHRMPLETAFNAVVDGTNGDTYLHSVAAKLGKSTFTTQGAVVDVKGVGHNIDLDVDIPAANIQDFLTLAVKTSPPVLTGIIQTKTKLHIAAGKGHVPERLSLRGDFHLRQIHFTNPKVEDKVDMLSLRAQGDPKPGAADVHSEMNGRFVLDAGRFKFSHLVFSMPGAHVNLDGVYSLDGQQFDFQGMVFTQAKISQMVASPWKSFLLRAVNPFFKGPNGGSEIPVKISGTRSEPRFGLDLHYKDESRINAAADRQNR